MPTKLEIREQKRLPLLKQVEIAVDGIHYRLLRSVLTLGVVVLAVAFLTNTLVETDLASACKAGVGALAEEQRVLSSLAAFIDQDGGATEVQQRIAKCREGSWILEAFSTWLGVSGPELSELWADCGAVESHYAWYESLKPGQRRLLAGKRTRDETFAMLAEPEARDKFALAARQIPLRLPSGFLEFAARHEEVLSGIASAAGSMSEARDKMRERMGGRASADWLGRFNEDPEGCAAAGEFLKSEGLIVADDQVAALVRQARARRRARELLALLGVSNVAEAWAKQFAQIFQQESVLVSLASDAEKAGWLASEAARRSPQTELDAVSVQAAARLIVDTRTIVSLEDRLAASYGEQPGLSAKTFWLLVVSFMVCVAGITNAMLVSVIERFREIATMKCLGALDGFIAKLFLLEAAFVGVVGGALGVVVGGSLGVARMVSGYGDWVWKFFPLTDLLAAAGICVVCGLALATLSALYPAYAAARMHPMEAMRVE